jgi:putative transposase
MAAVTELATAVGTRAACLALWVPRGSYYRDRRSGPSPIRIAPRPSSVRALAAAERETILAYLHHERFQDRSPAAVYATLLDEGQYHCSIRTMYRLLAAQGESRERRDHLAHPPYRKPELLAAAPNQLWSWDITKLLGPAKWTYFLSLRDSRCVQSLRHRLDGCHARKCRTGQAAHPGQLHQTTHPPRSAHPACRSRHLDELQGLAFLLADLGVTKTHSRPHVSDDNPHSESQFRTMKYPPEFPDRDPLSHHTDSPLLSHHHRLTHDELQFVHDSCWELAERIASSHPSQF